MKRLAALVLLLACAMLTARAQPVAEVVTIEGKGERREARSNAWEPARAKQPLNAADYVRTLDLSKMAILFADRTRLQLSQNSTLQIKGGGAQAPTTINLNAGRAWATSKSISQGLKMETPSATAAIRGTEWEMAVDENGAATLTVFSGEVELANEQGGVVVGVGEQARAERGKAPVKLQLRVSRERVQWVSSFTIDASRYGTRAELPEIAALIEEQRLADAYERLKQRVSAGGPPSASLLLADFEIYRGELPAAEKILREGAARHIADERFDVALARVALFDGRGDEARAAAKSAIAKRADSAEAWITLGDVERNQGHAREALGAYARAAQLAARDARPWLGIGIVESERENVRRARSHLETAIALDPREAGALAELGTLEGFAGNVAAAREALGKALDLDPRNYVALTGLGVVELRAGHPEAAADVLSRASLIEPRYARAHVYLAAALYELAGDKAALEELKRASELDPNDPLPHLLASIVYLDRIEPGFAAQSAQAALARLPFLKSLNQVADNQRGVANVGYPLAQMGLEAWARSAAQESYLPFWGGSHLFLSERYAGDFNRRSELMQGFITDPLVFGASSRFQSLFLEPGHHGTLSIRADTSDDLRLLEPVVTLNGYRAEGMPFAYFAEAGDTTTNPRNLAFDARMRRFTGALGAKPSHELGAFVYVNHFNADIDIGAREGTGELASISGHASRVDAGISYGPDASSRLWLKVGGSDEVSTVDDVTRLLLPEDRTLLHQSHFTTKPRGNDVAARYTRDWQDVEVTLGAESARVRNPIFLTQDASFHFSTTAIGQERLNETDRDRSDTVYATARYRVGALRFEGGVAWRDYRKDRDIAVSRDAFPGADIGLVESYRKRKTDPMAGVVWRLSQSALLRAACRRWLKPIAIDSLMPVAVAGVPLDDQLVFAGGDLEQCRVQGEWTLGTRTFIGAYAERIETNNLVSPLDGILNTRPDVTNLERLRNRIVSQPTKPDELEGDPVYAGGIIRRANIALEQIVTPRIGARVHYTYTDSENNDPLFAGKRVPYLARHLVNLGLTWSPGWHAFVTLQAIHRSRRYADEGNGAPLPPGWEGQVVIFVETPDKRWSAEVKALNLMKKETSDVFGIVVSYRF